MQSSMMDHRRPLPRADTKSPFAGRIQVSLRLLGPSANTISAVGEEVKQTSYPSNERLLKELRLRVCSVLRLISDEALQEGLRRAEDYIRHNPDDVSLRQDLFTLFSARRPG